MIRDLRWIIAMWFLDRALSIAPNDEAKRSLLLAIAPWSKRQSDLAKAQLEKKQ